MSQQQTEIKDLVEQIQELKHQLYENEKTIGALTKDVAQRSQQYLKTLSMLEQKVQEEYVPLFDFFKETILFSVKWEQFFPIYERYVSQYKKNNQPVNLLELGVQNGGSLDMWKMYFSEGSKIVGVDINPACQQIPFSEGITFILGDATNHDFVEQHFSDKSFDIIIDDASHHPHDVINSFNFLFPKLKDGGVYIIEDVHTSYWKDYAGGLRKPSTHMEYFKNISDVVNFNWIREDEYALFGSELEYSKKLSQEIAHVGFYDSVIVIEKFLQPLTRKFQELKSQGHILIAEYPKGIVCDENFVLEKMYR